MLLPKGPGNKPRNRGIWEAGLKKGISSEEMKSPVIDEKATRL
jgi:hypothetical protein